MAEQEQEEQQEQQDPNEPEGVRNLREANRRLKGEAAEGAAAVRKLAFIEAGLDPKNPQHQLLMKAYDGELTEEGIREQAAAYGLLPSEDDSEGEAPPPPAAAKLIDPRQTQARQNLGAESYDPDTSLNKGDPVEAMYSEFQRVRREEGATSEEASAAVFGGIFMAAQEGDQRFVFNAAEWQGSEAAKAR